MLLAWVLVMCRLCFVEFCAVNHSTDRSISMLVPVRCFSIDMSKRFVSREGACYGLFRKE